MDIELTALAAVALFMAVLGAYLLCVKPYLLGKREFRCARCGACCTFWVKLDADDIKRLTEAGKTDYMSLLGGIKRDDGYCRFLVRENGGTRCSVYEIRPKVCRDYPVSTGLFGKRMIDVRCGAYKRKKGEKTA